MNKLEVFTILGLSPHDPADILDEKAKKAFKRLVRKHHPDVGGDPEKFRNLTEAWETYQSQDFKKDIKQPREEDELFSAFRNFLLNMSALHGKESAFHLEDIRDISRHPSEMAFLNIWLQMAICSRYVKEPYQDANIYYVSFFPTDITLIRFLRVYAMKFMDRESGEFKTIEQMYLASLGKKGRP